jgi:hypothetical protein
MDIDFLLEAVKEDPQTYRDLAKFARDNPRPKTNPLAARMAAEQARKDAHRGAAADSRDIKRVSDYDKVGAITTIGDIAARYDKVKTLRRELALAVLKLERALSCQTERGHDMNEKNVPTAVKAAADDLSKKLTEVQTAKVVSSGAINYYKEIVKDCRTGNIDLEDEVERNSAVRDIILNTKRFGLDKFIKSSDNPVPLNTPHGADKAAWLENIHAENGKDDRDENTKKLHKDTENNSYAKMKEIASASERLREKIRKGEVPEGTSIKQLIDKENAERKAKGETVSSRYTNTFQNMASKAKLEELNIPTLDERPVEGCKSVKELVKKWAAEKKPQAGQIDIIFRGARGNNQDNNHAYHNNNTVTKPIVVINGNYYQVPQNDLFTTKQGGIALDDSPYVGYTKRSYKNKKELDPKHKELLNKIKIHTSVVTEEINFFDY